MIELYGPGEIELVDFPFTNLAESKRRPAMVLIDVGDADIVTARITRRAAADEYDVAIADWYSAGLRQPSLVRPHKLATIEKQVVGRRIGTLTYDDWVRVKESLERMWLFG